MGNIQVAAADQKNQEPSEDAGAKANRAIDFVMKRDGLRPFLSPDHTRTIQRLLATQEATDEWKRGFEDAGVKPEDIADFQLIGLPEDLREFEGTFCVTAYRVDLAQYNAILAAEGFTDEEWAEGQAVESEILTQLRKLVPKEEALLLQYHKKSAALRRGLCRYIGEHYAVLKKTSMIFEENTQFNDDEDDDSIHALIRGGHLDIAGSRLFAFHEMGCGPDPETEEEAYDSHFDALTEASEHWLKPEKLHAKWDKERAEFIAAHPELKNGCIDCQAEEDASKAAKA